MVMEYFAASARPAASMQQRLESLVLQAAQQTCLAHVGLATMVMGYFATSARHVASMLQLQAIHASLVALLM